MVVAESTSLQSRRRGRLNITAANAPVDPALALGHEPCLNVWKREWNELRIATGTVQSVFWWKELISISIAYADKSMAEMMVPMHVRRNLATCRNKPGNSRVLMWLSFPTREPCRVCLSHRYLMHATSAEASAEDVHRPKSTTVAFKNLYTAGTAPCCNEHNLPSLVDT